MAKKRMIDGWSRDKKIEIWEDLSSDPDILQDEVESIAIIPIIDTMDAAEERALRTMGLSTGYSELDRDTLGFGPGELIVVFGDTGHGKSQLCQNITYRIAKRGTPVLFIGLEMDNVENTIRFRDIADDTDEIAGLPILYPATNDIKLENIEQIMADGVKMGAEMVVLDHLHWLTRSVEHTTSEISLITHALKRLAVKYDTPLVVVSHINRTAGVDKAPTLGSLKGSSSIEQDADKAIVVWRDPKYRHLDEVQIIVRKNRKAPLPENGIVFKIKGVKIAEGFHAVFPSAELVS